MQSLDQWATQKSVPVVGRSYLSSHSRSTPQDQEVGGWASDVVIQEPLMCFSRQQLR